jgi:hypothetical protein
MKLFHENVHMKGMTCRQNGRNDWINCKLPQAAYEVFIIK